MPNTALDETGATFGRPGVVALVLFLRGSYQYAVFLISAVLAFVTVIAARINFPLPARLERGRRRPGGRARLLALHAGRRLLRTLLVVRSISICIVPVEIGPGYDRGGSIKDLSIVLNEFVVGLHWARKALQYSGS